MKKQMFLGIDTSNYMTSICFMDEQRKVIFEKRKLLEVKSGDTGLQQSQAVFQHVKNLPVLFQQATNLSDYTLSAIAVSRAPRPAEGSYMPAFLPGISVAVSMASSMNIPVYDTTHQEGHIAAGIYSAAEKPKRNHFLAVHLSGGTSEILSVKQTKRGYTIDQIGGTLDLHAGQLIDRIGVLLGFPFPAGAYVEQAGRESSQDFKRIPSSVKGYYFHFSGAEAEAKRRINNGEAKAEVARAIEHVIALSLEKSLKKAVMAGYPKEILLVGGVAQNQYIRDHLTVKLEHPKVGANLYFAGQNYSGDNAYGVANIAFNRYSSRKEGF